MDLVPYGKSLRRVEEELFERWMMDRGVTWTTEIGDGVECC